MADDTQHPRAGSSPRPPETVRLPGIGTRLDTDDSDGHALVLVRRNDGHVELHRPFDSTRIDLAADVAGPVGAFVAGHYVLPPSVAQRVGDLLGGLAFDWYPVRGTSRAVGRSIEELAIRRRTGATIVAIVRNFVPLIAPDPSTVLEAGDALVVAGRGQDLHRLDSILGDEHRGRTT